MNFSLPINSASIGKINFVAKNNANLTIEKESLVSTPAKLGFFRRLVNWIFGNSPTQGHRAARELVKNIYTKGLNSADRENLLALAELDLNSDKPLSAREIKIISSKRDSVMITRRRLDALEMKKQECATKIHELRAKSQPLVIKNRKKPSQDLQHQINGIESKIELVRKQKTFFEKSIKEKYEKHDLKPNTIQSNLMSTYKLTDFFSG